MKTLLGSMLMLVLAGSTSAMAQTNSTSDSSMKKKDMMMGEKMSMTGCVSEKDGKYMMMDKAHPDGVQLMTSDDLKPHVGHKMKMTGMMEKMDDMGTMKADNAAKPDGSAKADGPPPSDATMKHDDMSMKHDGMAMMEMKVTSMKMISTTCDMSKMMDK